MVNDKFSQPLPNLPLPFDMIPVEGGTFDMGDEHGDLPNYCRPVHQVKVSGFYIGKYPVTQAVWKAVMNGENPSGFRGDYRPVEQVSWDDAQEFIMRLNDLKGDTRPAGHFYRLPTEAEWEFAARGGKYFTEGYKYAGSDRLKDVGWFGGNNGKETSPAGQKQPNQLGIYDMSGNVWEWCEDWYGGTDYYERCRKAGIIADPPGLVSDAFRVYRGGSWFSPARSCRAAYRGNNAPGYRFSYLGFRLALSLQADGRSTPAFL